MKKLIIGVLCFALGVYNYYQLKNYDIIKRVLRELLNFDEFDC